VKLMEDSDAGGQTDTTSGVYGYNACCFTNSVDRGSSDYVERNDKCGSRSRSETPIDKSD
jgi:hypothetical protein